MIGDHLNPSVRESLFLTKQERITEVRKQRWVGYGGALRAHDKLNDLYHHPPSLRMKGAALVGPYNNGKTMIVERFGRQFIEKVDDGGVLLVEAPAGYSLGRLLTALLDAFEVPPQRNQTIAVKEMQLDHLFRTYHQRMLIIDEFHRMIPARSRDLRAIYAYLRSIGKKHNVVTVLVGDVRVAQSVYASPEMATRMDLIGVPKWPFDRNFLAFLKAIEGVLPLAQPSCLWKEPLCRRIYELGEGLIGEFVRIVTDAAAFCIAEDVDAITPESLDAIAFEPLSTRLAPRDWSYLEE